MVSEKSGKESRLKLVNSLLLHLERASERDYQVSLIRAQFVAPKSNSVTLSRWLARARSHNLLRWPMNKKKSEGDKIRRASSLAIISLGDDT